MCLGRMLDNNLVDQTRRFALPVKRRILNLTRHQSESYSIMNLSNLVFQYNLHGLNSHTRQ